MSPSTGYINSQTWEAWYESWVVVYGNASLVLVLSFLLSVAAAAAVYLLPTLQQPQPDEANQIQLERDIDSNEDLIRKKTDGDTDQDHYHDECNGISQARKDALEAMNAEGGGGCIFTHGGLRRRKEEPSMSPFYQRKEKEVTNEQLATIHRIMQEQRDKFGDTSMEDLVDQLKLYNS
ncbi:hypothetical protein FHG87_000239 [Trinorchestia longiramus]|nr:hypothetical protein FHG87_000239 [Trinorchestia longiramus]